MHLESRHLVFLPNQYIVSRIPSIYRVRYKLKWGLSARIYREEGDPDRVCLSMTHDRDYKAQIKRLGRA